ATVPVTLSAQLTTSRTDPLVLSRLLETDVWYRTYWIRSDIRLSYGLAAAGSGQDPLNPKSLPEGVGLGPSYVELPTAPPQPWIAVRPGVPKGALVEERIASKILKAERTAWVYTPAGYDATRATPYPVLICFDGTLYTAMDTIPTPAILDNLIAAGEIPAM